MAPPEIVTSERGGQKLLMDGFIYYKGSSSKGNTYWQCNRKKDGECSARAITKIVRGQLTVSKGPAESIHSHPPSIEEMESEKLKVSLKRTAREQPEITPAQILRSKLQAIPSGILAHLPDRENLKKTIRRDRKKNQPSNPTSLKQLKEILQKYKQTLLGDRFLLHDSYKGQEEEEEEAEHPEEEEHSDRVIIFSTRRNLELLMKSNVWFLDRTFKVSPGIFTQLFTIIGIVRRRLTPEEDSDDSDGSNSEDDINEYAEVAFPFIYALLSSKKQALYTTVLRETVNVARELNIQVTEPEKGIINAVDEVFSDRNKTAMSCCLFHLGKNLYERVKSEALQEDYNNPNDRTLRDFVHMTLALAFVPVTTVSNTFEHLRNEAPDNLIPVLDYFDTTYVNGIPARGRRRGVAPRYPPRLWNQYEAAKHYGHRTNNLSEAWHNRFQWVVGKHHPSLYSALTELQKEQGETESMLQDLALGKSVKAKPKKKWLLLQKGIRNIVLQYRTYEQEGNILDSLRNIGHNIMM